MGAVSSKNSRQVFRKSKRVPRTRHTPPLPQCGCDSEMFQQKMRHGCDCDVKQGDYDEIDGDILAVYENCDIYTSKPSFEDKTDATKWEPYGSERYSLMPGASTLDKLWEEMKAKRADSKNRDARNTAKQDSYNDSTYLSHVNQFPEISSLHIMQVADNIPAYLAGRFAVQLGMTLVQWEYVISLKEQGSPRLRVVNDICKSGLHVTKKAREVLAPLLIDTDPSWDAILQVIQDDNWKIIAESLKQKEAHVCNEQDRVYYLKHMTTTLMEIVNGRVRDMATCIIRAADATLPMVNRNNMREIFHIKVSREKDDDRVFAYNPPQGSFENDITKYAEVKISHGYSKEEAMHFFKTTGCSPEDNSKVLESLKKYLMDTDYPGNRDFSLFGDRGFEKYQELSQHITQQMNEMAHEWRPIGIAIIDSGCTEHLREKRRMILGPYRNYINNVANILEDRNGHGSLVTEIIHRYCGFAYVKIYHYIAMDENLTANPNDIVHALQEISNNPDIDIINLSFQSQTFSAKYKDTLDKLGRKKIVISAAGNDFFGNMQCIYPAQNAMVIPIGGLDLDISADAAEPFVHLRCPPQSCDPSQEPATSYAAAHATALAAILLRYADILDQQVDVSMHNTDIDDSLLVRVSSEWPWVEEISHIQGQLPEVKRVMFTGPMTRREAFFEKLKVYSLQKNLDFYTVQKVAMSLLETCEDTAELGAMKTTKEILWYISQTVSDIQQFAHRFTTKLKEMVRIPYLQQTMEQTNWSSIAGNEIPSSQLVMFRMLSCYTKKCAMKPVALLNKLQTALIRTGFSEAANYLPYIFQGPCRRKLLTCKEHMQTLLINTNHGLLWDGDVEAVKFALINYTTHIDNIARSNCYPDDVPKFRAQFRIQESPRNSHTDNDTLLSKAVPSRSSTGSRRTPNGAADPPMTITPAYGVAVRKQLTRF